MRNAKGQRITALLAIQGFIRWGIQEGIIKDGPDHLSRYIAYLKERRSSENETP
jgi:hypothetical protein